MSPASGRPIQVLGKFRDEKKPLLFSCVSKAAVCTGYFFPITSGIELCYKKDQMSKYFLSFEINSLTFDYFLKIWPQLPNSGSSVPDLKQAQVMIFAWKTRFSSHNVPAPNLLPPWRHCEFSKYVFCIVEVYTKALKKHRVEHIFSSWRKLM